MAGKAGCPAALIAVHPDIKLSTPDTGDIGTNPEQLFAAGWSACFEGAMAIAARKIKITLPAELAVDGSGPLPNRGGARPCKLASTSAYRVWSAKSPRPWWTRGPDVSVFQSHPRQHRCRDQPGLESQTCNGTVLKSQRSFHSVKDFLYGMPVEIEQYIEKYV